MIKGILEILNSERDRNGNTYWAFRFTDCKTGRVVEASAPAESNVTCVFNHEKFRGWKWSEIRVHNTTMGKRAFARLTSDWTYPGCTPDEIRAFILDTLKQGARA